MAKLGRSKARQLKKELVKKRGHKCEVCGWTKTVQLHHIDEDPTNNTEFNSVILCPNHHSLAHVTDVKIKLTIQFFRKLLSHKFGYVY